MLIFFQRAANSARSLRCLSMAAADQSRVPPGRSIRFTSSSVNGAYLARHVQKSPASLSRGSVSGFCAGFREHAQLNTSRIEISAAQEFFMFTSLIHVFADYDYRRSATGSIHRRAVAGRGGFFAHVTNFIQLFVPPLHVGAVSGLRALGNRDIAISVSVRNADSPGSGIGVAQFGDKRTSR